MEPSHAYNLRSVKKAQAPEEPKKTRIAEPKNPRSQDRRAVSQIAKGQGIEKTEAVLQHVERCRKESSKEKKEPNEKIPREMMPWAPDLRRYNLHSRFSALPEEDHRRYVSIIANFLKPDPYLRFEYNKEELKGMDEAIEEERRDYEKEMLRGMVKDKTLKRFDFLPGGAHELVRTKENERCVSAVHTLKFGIGGGDPFLDWVNQEDNEKVLVKSSSCYLKASKEALEDGLSPDVVLPNMRKVSRFNTRPDVVREYLSKKAQQLTVEMDSRMVSLAYENQIEYLMDASTLRHLMSDPWPHRSQSFVIRLTVGSKSSSGKIRRSVTFSKPVLASPLEGLYVVRQYTKWVLKAALYNVCSSDHLEPKMEKDEGEVLGDGSQGLNLKVERVQPVTLSDLIGTVLKSNQAAPKTPIFRRSQPSLDAKSLTMTPGRQRIPTLTPLRREQDQGDGVRKRYVVVYLGEGDTQPILIRTSNHGQYIGEDGEQKSISVTVKADFFPELGAEKHHQEEKLWGVITGILKGSVENVNFRINPQTGNCLQVQREDSRLAASKSNEIRKLLAERTDRVRRLLGELHKLNPGHYLIVQQDGKLHLLTPLSKQKAQELQEGDSSTIFDSETSGRACSRQPLITSSTESIWNGVDYHLPLQWHIVRMWMPGTYPPSRSHTALSLESSASGDRPQVTNGGVLSLAEKRKRGSECLETREQGSPEAKRPAIDTAQDMAIPQRSVRTYDDFLGLGMDIVDEEPCNQSGCGGPASQQGVERSAASEDGAVTSLGVPPVVQQSDMGQLSVLHPPCPVVPVEPATPSPAKPNKPESAVSSSKQECLSLSQREKIPVDKVKDGGELFNNWVLQFSKMLREGDKCLADCTIEVGDEKIKVHRSILSINSSVFRDQFVNDKSQEGGCVIRIGSGFSVASVKAMVHYFYHGGVDSKELGECGVELFRIADKYQLDSLKSFVAQHLSSTVDVENVLTLLADADCCLPLKKACARVVSANRAVVLASDQWEKMEESHRKLLFDLLKSIVLENEK